MNLFHRLMSKCTYFLCKELAYCFTLRKPLALENINLQEVGFLKAKIHWVGQTIH